MIPVRRGHGGWLFLLLRAYNYWDFPKGEVRPEESPLAAACRETDEETGIEELDFSWGEVYYQTAPYSGGKVARYYLARTSVERVRLGISPELGRPEHHEARWVDQSEARHLLGQRVRAALEWAAGLLAQRPEPPPAPRTHAGSE